MAGKISSRRSSPGCIGGKPRFGSFLIMNLSSVIVFQINVEGIALDPTECNAPVSAGAHRIAALSAANERMKAESRQIHVLWTRCVVERAQNVGYPSCILHAEPASVPGREKPFELLVPERADHSQ